jgi:hypothetical protein
VAAETGFTIDGTIYEVPDLESLRMGERHILFDLCGYVQEDLVAEDGETEEAHRRRVQKIMRHPGFMEAWMLIAYLRGKPGVSREEAQRVISETNYLSAVATMGDDEEEVPLASTTEPAEASGSGPVVSSNSSGDDSTNDSASQVDGPTPIGTSRSATSFPPSLERTSVA